MSTAVSVFVSMLIAHMSVSNIAVNALMRNNKGYPKLNKIGSMVNSKMMNANHISRYHDCFLRMFLPSNAVHFEFDGKQDWALQ